MYLEQLNKEEAYQKLGNQGNEEFVKEMKKLINELKESDPELELVTNSLEFWLLKSEKDQKDNAQLIDELKKQQAYLGKIYQIFMRYSPMSRPIPPKIRAVPLKN